MKLKRKYNKNISLIQKNKNKHHKKSTSLDADPSYNLNKSIYVNKVLEKSLGKKNKDSEFINIIPNFQKSIRNILSNEDKREKAIRYIINMRKKQRVFSPVYIKSKYLIKYQNNNEFDTYRMNDNFLRTMDEGFYSTRNIKKKNKFQSVQEVDNINYNLNSNTINIDKSYFGINNSKKNSTHNYNEIIPNLSQKGFECFLPETVIKVNKTNNTNNSKIYNNNV